MRAFIQSHPIKSTAIALGAAATAFAATSAAAAISSNVFIDGGETFVLGGAQPGAFNVRGQNRGDVAVEVFAAEDGKHTLVATVKPGERFNAPFARGEGALLRNTSTQERAHVRVRITGTTSNLGMGYETWQGGDSGS